MTTITTTCTGCGRALAVPERYQGRDLKCPGCGHSFRVEVPTPPAPAPTSVPTPTPPVAATAPPPDAAGPFGDLFTAPSDTPAVAPKEAEVVTVGSAPVYWRLARIGVPSAGLVGAVIHAALGLLVGAAVFLASLFLPASAIPLLSARLFGGLAVVAFPIFYGVAGFLVGAVTALIYNLTARLVGGVKVLLE